MLSGGKKSKKNTSNGVYPTPETTPAPEIPNWKYQATVEDERSGQPTASGSATENTPHLKSATPGSEQLAASGSTTENTSQFKSATPGSEQQPASSSTTQQTQDTNTPQLKSATPSPEQPAASTSTTQHPEEPKVLPDPDIPLPSIENDVGREMLYMRRRAARKHVMVSVLHGVQ